MAVDKRTFIIVAIIAVVALPAIILVFHKSFFPIITSVERAFESAALTSSRTGLAPVK